ncbi:MAG: hypothetical protein ACTSRS_03225 [Candidatus Helarchaeota archaeon]
MTIKFKVVLVGSSEKNQEVLLLEEKDLIKGKTYETKLGLDFKLEYKIIEDKDINLVLWLMKGEKYKEIKQEFYEGADGIVILFDTSQEENTETVIRRIRELRANSPNSSILLIGKNIRVYMNQIIEGYTKQLIKEGKIKEKLDINIDCFDIDKDNGLVPEEFLDFLARKLLSRSKY